MPSKYFLYFLQDILSLRYQESNIAVLTLSKAKFVRPKAIQLRWARSEVETYQFSRKTSEALKNVSSFHASSPSLLLSLPPKSHGLTNCFAIYYSIEAIFWVWRTSAFVFTTHAMECRRKAHLESRVDWPAARNRQLSRRTSITTDTGGAQCTAREVALYVTTTGHRLLTSIKLFYATARIKRCIVKADG